MKLYMFRTVPLSIIRSYSLYTQKWYMSYRFVDSFRAETLRVSDSTFVHQQELFTVHSAVVYVIQVFRQLSSSRILILLESYLQTCTTYTIAECTVNNS
jgi:hypothetical protein